MRLVVDVEFLLQLPIRDIAINVLARILLCHVSSCWTDILDETYEHVFSLWCILALANMRHNQKDYDSFIFMKLKYIILPTNFRLTGVIQK